MARYSTTRALIASLLTGSSPGFSSSFTADDDPSHFAADSPGRSPFRKYVKPKSGKITFVQISDIHLDVLYAEVRCIHASGRFNFTN